MTTLCFGLVIGASTILADPPEITLNGSDAEVSLPDAVGGQSFRVLERSEDFSNWEPVARDYGNGWENIFPFTLPVSPTGPGQIAPVEAAGLALTGAAALAAPTSFLSARPARAA